MKAIALVLIFAASASAQTFDQRVDELQRLNLQVRDQLVIAQTELKAATAAVTTAKAENATQNAAFNAERGELKSTIKKQQRTLDNAWVKAALFIRATLYWIVGVYVGLSLLAFVGGVMAPGSAMFLLSGKLISAIPFANWIESAISLFQRTTMVRAKEVPIVTPPAVVAPASPVPESARVAMQRYADGLDTTPTAEGAVVTSGPPNVPPVAPSAMAQAFYGTRSVGEILQGVRRS